MSLIAVVADLHCDSWTRWAVDPLTAEGLDIVIHHGVEPICNVLPIAPCTYYDHLAKRADPSRLSDRARQDEALRPEILRVFEENWRVYGVRKVWRQLGREGFDVARCTVARLMKSMGIQGIMPRRNRHVQPIAEKSHPAVFYDKSLMVKQATRSEKTALITDCRSFRAERTLRQAGRKSQPQQKSTY